ncbi:hypothetical protein [Oerskovia paurometabola]|uniref:Uncharacterized protein n=1 Tax=Oerskovia paurometabola TaxID=162170 RepID=A0ABW1X9K3_9CELL|nr:hypothetical protein [Oerskovia paurometabola]MBM7495728.1 hypothetical protein [Oerskovia paurometabola]
MRTAAITTTVLLSVAVLTGCKGGETGPGQPTPSPTSTSSPTPSPTTPPVTPTPTPTPTDPTTPTEPGENEVSIRVQIPERTAPPSGD